MPRSRFFPDPRHADAHGWVCLGDSLETPVLLDAYRHGIFPWPVPGYPVPWCSPDPRGILPLEKVHISRRLQRTIRSGRFETSIDRDFRGVITGCAGMPERRDEVWITASMIEAYCRLHEEGHAHSVETWQGGELVGGVYGVAIGRFFAGESMFHRATDASKVALARLIEHLRGQGCLLFDIQMVTAPTARFGAVEVSRNAYLDRLAAVMQVGGRMTF